MSQTLAASTASSLAAMNFAMAKMPMFHSIPMQYPLPMVIGHRGAKDIAPENTIAAMRAAKAVGTTCVEVDVMLTKDGVPVIHHDNTVDRCTTGAGRLQDLNWAELRELDVGSHFCPDFKDERIPSLKEMVEVCWALGLDLNIEIKHSNDDAALVPTEEERLREVELATVTCLTLLSLDADPERVFLSSFSIPALEVAQAMLPHFRRSYLVEDIPLGWAEMTKKLGCASFQFWHEKVCQEEIEACALTGIPLYAYTVNDPARAEELISWGLSGVFSDAPHLVRRHLWARGLDLSLEKTRRASSVSSDEAPLADLISNGMPLLQPPLS
ncbi:PLC-like phosphodiesterase [Baffinella frigidus]|nr:PLC-like phosphodiesterase [Cryptophyta sp. CCMP2293]